MWHNPCCVELRKDGLAWMTKRRSTLFASWMAYLARVLMPALASAQAGLRGQIALVVQVRPRNQLLLSGRELMENAPADGLARVLNPVQRANGTLVQILVTGQENTVPKVENSTWLLRQTMIPMDIFRPRELPGRRLLASATIRSVPLPLPRVIRAPQPVPGILSLSPSVQA